METNLKFNSAICTSREQSERLLALGLKKETADMRYQMQYLDLGGVLKECTPSLEPYPPLNNDRFIPAWSLHRLIEMMPCGFQDEHYRNFVLKINSQDVSYVCNYVDDDGYGQSDSIDVDDVYHNLYDGIISHIKWLIKKGLFNKDYLEE